VTSERSTRTGKQTWTFVPCNPTATSMIPNGRSVRIRHKSAREDCVFADCLGRHEQDRHLCHSMISGGCVVSGGLVNRSVLSHNVRIDEDALVEDSVILDGVHVCRGARIGGPSSIKTCRAGRFLHRTRSSFDQSRFTILRMEWLSSARNGPV